MSLASLMQADASAVFCNASDFAEAVVYTKKSTGATRTINAIVDKNPPTRINGSGEIVTPMMVITVVNSTTLGIGIGELNAYGNDTITVTYRNVSRAWGIYIPDSSAGEWDQNGLLMLDLK